MTLIQVTDPQGRPAAFSPDDVVAITAINTNGNTIITLRGTPNGYQPVVIATDPIEEVLRMIQLAMNPEPTPIDGEPTLVPCDPGNLQSVPWSPGCDKCASLRAADDPGLSTWVSAVGRHFIRDHNIALVQE